MGSIHYEVFGEGPPLVLSHGVIENAQSWAQVTPFLSDHLQVVVHEARGRGGSEWDGTPFGFAELADDVAALTDHLGLGKFFHAGHSMGGRVVLEHALAHPDRVAGLAVISSRAEAPDDAGRARLAALADRAAVEGPGSAVAPWAKLTDAYFQRARAISEANPLGGTQAALRALVEMNSLVPRLGEIETRTLVIAGDLDSTYLRSARLMETTIPHVTLRILDGIGHFPNLECPALLADELIHFFSGSAE